MSALTPAERKAMDKRQNAAMASKHKKVEVALKALGEKRERLLSNYAYEMFCLLKSWQSGLVTNEICNRRDRIIEIFS